MSAVVPDTRRAPVPLVRARALRVGVGAAGALHGLDLEVTAGEVLAVAGEPGAGKTTLLRCLAGDLPPTVGAVERVAASEAGGVGGTEMVWQDLALCENLDVAGNLLLGRETRRLMASPSRMHAAAREILEELRIPIHDTTRLAAHLSGAEQQMLAIARASSGRPSLLLLDEPTANLGLAETAQVEALVARLARGGTTIVLATRDIEQMFRLATRILVLRHGAVVADLEPENSHPDDVAALLSGQPVDSSARRQLTRLHGVADRLGSDDPSSGPAMILSALSAALSSSRACIHVHDRGVLLCAAAQGLTADEVARLDGLPAGDGGGAVGRAVATGSCVLEPDVWTVPVIGPDGVSAAISVFPDRPSAPARDELDLITLYAGLAASAVERDRLVAQVTARNRVLETIREMLETLAGPAPGETALSAALDSLRRGVRADEAALLTWGPGEAARWRARTTGQPIGEGDDAPPADPGEVVRRIGGDGQPSGTATESLDPHGRLNVAVPFSAPGGFAALVATWSAGGATHEDAALLEDAAHSLRLALEREQAARAHQEAAALRRSRELQREFLSRLSHELRTPLTAIRGYASSLMAGDVTWDGVSQRRFLGRIASESARLGRLVDDLLDFSAIESGVMRLSPDWCELPLVAAAAVECLPAEHAARVEVRCEPNPPPVWADHDRLEQVLLNLLSNAFRHNPPGVSAWVSVETAPGVVELSVADDGPGFPADRAGAPFARARHRARSAGAGLGLSIARGIVEAHGGTIGLDRAWAGTRFVIHLPAEPPAVSSDAAVALAAPGHDG